MAVDNLDYKREPQLRSSAYLRGSWRLGHHESMEIANGAGGRDNGPFGLGLTEAEVRRLQYILRRECGVELTLQGAWARAIELLAFARMLVEALPRHDLQNTP